MNRNRSRRFQVDMRGASELRLVLGAGRRGPLPGHGSSGHPGWWGLCEETPQLWAGWVAAAWRQVFGAPLPERPPFQLVVAGVVVPLESARRTFGWRWYFRCPRCARRSDVLYRGLAGLACRRCNRLGYRRQARRRGPGPLQQLCALVAPPYGRRSGGPVIAELVREFERGLTVVHERRLCDGAV